MKHITTSMGQRFKLDYLLVVLMGLACLWVSYTMFYRGPVLVDEVMYVVVGRNLVEQSTLNTNLYWTESVVKHGYPTKDYHAPGYMITLAGFFVLAGFDKVIIGLPNQIAYLLTGLIFYNLGKSLFRPSAALLATFIFYIYPINFIYANLVMIEAGAGLLTVIYLLFLVRIQRSQASHGFDGITLAVLLVVGMLYRQTFAVFLPPTLFILIQVGVSRKNYRPLILFNGFLLVLLAGLFWPLIQNRSYYPNPFDRMMEVTDWLTRWEIFESTVFNNIKGVFTPLPVQRYVALVNLILVVISILAIKFSDRSHKMLAWLFAYLLWTTVVMFTIFYKSVVDLTIARNLAAMIMPELLLFVVLMLRLKLPLVRYGGMAMFVILVGYSTWHFAQNVQKWQTDAIQEQQKIARIFTQYLQPYAPQTIAINRGYGLAWSHYPLTVVADLPTDYDQMRIIEERLPLDVIAVDSQQQRDVITDAVSRNLLKQRYRLLFPDKVEGYYFFIDERLQGNQPEN